MVSVGWMESALGMRINGSFPSRISANELEQMKEGKVASISQVARKSTSNQLQLCTSEVGRRHTLLSMAQRHAGLKEATARWCRQGLGSTPCARRTAYGQ